MDKSGDNLRTCNLGTHCFWSNISLRRPGLAKANVCCKMPCNKFQQTGVEHAFCIYARCLGFKKKVLILVQASPVFQAAMEASVQSKFDVAQQMFTIVFMSKFYGVSQIFDAVHQMLNTEIQFF